MNAIKIETVIATDGELHLSHLPCQKGDRVEAILLIPEHRKDEVARQEARQRFLALAKASRFRSSGAYPSREELHERTVGTLRAD